MSKTATRIKRVNPNDQGDQVLYELDEPVGYNHDWDTNKPTDFTTFVVVSAANVPFSGPETYIFPADADGHILDWGELDGSSKGTLDHSAAIALAGWIEA